MADTDTKAPADTSAVMSDAEAAWESYKEILWNSEYYKRVLAEMYENSY